MPPYEKSMDSPISDGYLQPSSANTVDAEQIALEGDVLERGSLAKVKVKPDDLPLASSKEAPSMGDTRVEFWTWSRCSMIQLAALGSSRSDNIGS